MFVTGPNVVKTVTNEEVSSEDLGGAFRSFYEKWSDPFVVSNDFDCIPSKSKDCFPTSSKIVNETENNPFQLCKEYIEISHRHHS